MGPFSPPDGHDFPGLIDELVPSLAAEGDDLVIGFELPVGQPVVAHELPDVLDRIELERAGRQGHEGDVGGGRELVDGMPSGLIEEDDGMVAGRHLGSDLVEMA